MAHDGMTINNAVTNSQIGQIISDNLHLTSLVHDLTAELAQMRRSAPARAGLMPKSYTVRHLRTNQIRVLTAQMLPHFFNNRDPRDWTDPVPVCATEWVS